VRWQTADPATSPSASRFPGLLDVEANLSRADGTRVHRYLPLSVGDDVRRYLRAAIRAAGPTEVSFRIKGDMWDMPTVPAGPDHAFRIGARFRDVEFDYVPAYLQDPSRRYAPLAGHTPGRRRVPARPRGPAGLEPLGHRGRRTGRAS
jgi:hypothetical protein